MSRSTRRVLARLFVAVWLLAQGVGIAHACAGAATAVPPIAIAATADGAMPCCDPAGADGGAASESGAVALCAAQCHPGPQADDLPVVIVPDAHYAALYRLPDPADVDAAAAAPLPTVADLGCVSPPLAILHCRRQD